MVKRTENGDYEINGTVIEKENAWELFDFIQFENRKEDVLSKLEDGIESGSYEESLLKDNEFIELAARHYENAIENDDSWNYQVDDAIDEATKEYPSLKKDCKNIERE